MRVYDGDLSFDRGQHTGRFPYLLGPGQYALGINVSNRRGALEPREGYRPLPLSGGITGRFQGAIRYQPGDQPRLIVVAGGRVFQVLPDGTVITLTAEPVLDAGVREVYLTEAADAVVLISDGRNRPWVVEDEAIREADETMLPGRWMAYGQGRVFQVSVDQRVIYASDIYSPLTTEFSALSTFTETPRGFVPHGIGRITGITFLPILDNGTGMGALVVTGQRGIYAFDVVTPREQWDQLKIGRLIAGNVGVLSHRSLVEVNGDIYFRRPEGIGSLISARADWQTPINRPISHEVRGWLDDDEETMLGMASTSYHDNKVRMTFAPERSADDEICFRGLVTMDLEADSGLQRGQVSYPGIETGLKPLQLLDKWLLARDSQGALRVYEMTSKRRQIGDRSQFTGPDTVKPIPWEVETRAYDFGQAVLPKQLGGTSYIDLAEMRSNVRLKVFFKPDQYPGWLLWTEKLIELSDCAHGEAGYYRLALGDPEEAEKVNPLTKRLARECSHVQLRFEVEGHARIERIRVAATVERESDHVDDGYLEEISPMAPVVPCEKDPFTYSLEPES